MSEGGTVEALWSRAVFSPVPVRNAFEVTVDHVLNDTQLNVLSGDLNNNTILSNDLNNVSILKGALSGNKVDVDILTVDVSKALNVNICSVAIDIAGVDVTNTVCL